MIPIMSLFCVCYSHALVSIDDDEFFEQQRYFTLKEVTEMTGILKVSRPMRMWIFHCPLLLTALSVHRFSHVLGERKS